MNQHFGGLSSRTPSPFTESNEKQNKNSFLFSSNADSGSLLTGQADAGSRSLKDEMIIWIPHKSVNDFAG